MEKRRNCSLGYISNFRSQITHSFVKYGCSIYFFFLSANLICRGKGISKYFGVPWNSRLYLTCANTGCSGLVHDVSTLYPKIHGKYGRWLWWPQMIPEKRLQEMCLVQSIFSTNNNSRIPIARTPMARLPSLIPIRFWIPTKFFFLLLLLLFFHLGFTALSVVFLLYQADRSSKVGENPGKNHLTIRKQNLAFPHVTRLRLKPQRWET